MHTPTTPPTAGGQGGSVRLERRPLSDLKPAAYNPRSISPRALAGLGASVREFGLVQPVVWNVRTGNVVGGHQRLKALASQGVTETDVVVVDLDDARERALNLALNSPAIAGDFTAAALPMVEDLLRTLPDLASAVRLPQLAAYLRTTVRTPASDLEPEAPEPPADPVTQPGDVWRLGAHRLVCGDSRDAAVLRQATGGEAVECLWTDPPYGVAYEGGTAERLSIANDQPDDLRPLLAAALPAIDAVLAPAARWYIAAPAGPQGTVFRNAIEAQGWRLHQVLAWVKDAFVLGYSDYHYRHEDVLYGWKAGPGGPNRSNRETSRWNGGDDQDTVLEVPRPKRSAEHPTMKPVELVRRCLRNSTRRGDLVLDAFAGSGATLLACESLGRRAAAVEISARFCDVIVARWERLTGQRAERVRAAA